MKSIPFILFVLMASFGFAQEGISVKGNTVSMREIPPVWPGCEGGIREKEKCFQVNLAKHIQGNFDFSGYTESDKDSRILVHFTIDKEGRPAIKKVEGGSEALRKEAKRVILLLPKMKPGSLGGKPTEVEYTVPFNF